MISAKTKDGKCIASIGGNGGELIEEIVAVIEGLVNSVREKLGDKDAAKVFWLIAFKSASEMLSSGLDPYCIDPNKVLEAIYEKEKENDDDGITIPSDIFKKFMEGGNLLF